MATVTPNSSTLSGATAVTDITTVNVERLNASNLVATTPLTLTTTTTTQVDALIAQSTTIEAKIAAAISTASGPTAQTVGVAQPTSEYKWNLPPHTWSLPVRPASVDYYAVGSNSYSSFHGMRRGRIWFWAGASDISTFDASGNATTLGNQVASAKAAAGASTTNDTSSTLKQSDNFYGFQFLWNPTTISTGVTRNMDITPSPADTLKVVAGAFPGQETVSLTIVLDRVNDFACLRAYRGNSRVYTSPGDASPTQQSYIDINDADSDPRTINYSDFTNYYLNRYPNESAAGTNEKIQNLMAQGTMADLEYLFKAINGGYAWKNLLGKETANIGFLMPTLLGVQLGPTLDSLNYVGWITNLGIQHTDFTENMIPVRTIVSINIDCFSGSGIKAV